MANSATYAFVGRKPTLVLMALACSGLLLSLLLVPTAAAMPKPKKIAIIVHASNKTKFDDVNQLRQIYTSSKRFWSDGNPILAFNAIPKSSIRALFDQTIFGMNPLRMGQYWVEQRIRGGPRPPRQMGDLILVQRIIAKLPNGIAYVPAEHLIHGTRVVAYIENGKIRFVR